MTRSFRRTTLISLTLLALTGIAFTQTPSRSPSSRKPRKLAAHKAMVLPPMPSGPLPQVPMDQLPSTPPQVSYQNGMLAIVAQNSTLGDILREVHKRTGASIDVPANATERVATRLGPGPARDVLADLLNGSAFNYVMVGSPKDPAVLSSLALTPKAARGTTENAAYQAPQPYVPQPYTPAQGQVVPAPGMGPGGPVVHPAQGEEEADSSDEEADDNADEAQDQDESGDAANGDGAQQQPNSGPKTPEQILDMLRQRQQQTPPGQFPRQNPPPQQQQPQPDNQ